MTFDSMWADEVFTPVANGTFDPVGSNYGPSSFEPPTGPATSPHPGAFSDLPNLNGITAGSFGPSPAGRNVYDPSTGIVNHGSMNLFSGGGNTLAPNTGLPSDVANKAGTGVAQTDWASYFVRGVIVILGFIFVAVGLTMFARNEALPSLPR